jgi:Glycosyl transferase family 2.
VSFNRLSYLEQLVKWLCAKQIGNVVVLDNNSTYPPLLEYYDKECPYKVIRLPENLGHCALWHCKQFDSILAGRHYIVTDCDIVPVEECPGDVIEYLLELSNVHKDVTKVGLSLKIDDLPDHYIFKDAVIEWEKQYYENKLGEYLYKAQLDTTFALYRPGTKPLSATKDNLQWFTAIRTAFPYQARHLPWYEDSGKTSQEALFYQQTRIPSVSNWDTHNISELQVKYVQLRKSHNILLERFDHLKAMNQILMRTVESLKK